MELSAEQQSQIATWIREGASLAEVQRRIESDFGQRMTYMDVRFLVDDLALELPEKPAAVQPEDIQKAPEPKPDDLLGAPGKVSVTLDKLMRPGALVSGSVTFSDGVKATWMLDQMGRLGLDGVEKSYRPPEEDMATFQSELQTELGKAGYA